MSEHQTFLAGLNSLPVLWLNLLRTHHRLNQMNLQRQSTSEREMSQVREALNIILEWHADVYLNMLDNDDEEAAAWRLKIKSQIDTNTLAEMRRTAKQASTRPAVVAMAASTHPCHHWHEQLKHGMMLALDLPSMQNDLNTEYEQIWCWIRAGRQAKWTCA